MAPLIYQYNTGIFYIIQCGCVKLSVKNVKIDAVEKMSIGLNLPCS